MAIEIIIEDGSIVPDANSFATVEDARIYASNRGVEIAPVGVEGDEQVKVLLIKASDWFRVQSWNGAPVDLGQSMPFPRTGLYIYPSSPWTAFPDDEIPRQVVEAQCRLCMDIKAGVDVLPTHAAGTGMIVREKVGPIETQFSEKVGAYTLPRMTQVEAMLAAFLSGASGGRLRTLRI